jgi:C-terminal processing protease CtpA/Prc
MLRKYRILPLWVIMMALFVFSCEEEKVKPEDGQEPVEQDRDTTSQINQAFYNLMKEWYLWYDTIPDINPGEYENPQAVLEEIRFEKDVWSYITSYDAFQQYYEQGAYVGYGFGYKWDASDSLRITFVFDDSPMSGKQIERGWVIDKINGQSVSPSDNISQLLGSNEPGVENRFELKGPGGTTVDTSFAKEEITMNTVLMDTVLNYNNKNVGYFVLKSFIDKTPDELTEVFRNFNDKNIDELIVDLRYNGGGTLSASRFLGEFLVDQANQTYVKISHNEKRTQYDTTHYFGQDSLNLSLGLDRTYFISTQATASASEALINGLKPYMEVYNIGRQTYGKPVGMYAFSDRDKKYAFVPVCFRLENANGVADYYEGLPVDVTSRDDITQPFGSMEEECFYQALYHIKHGSFDKRKTGYPVIPENKVDYNSLRDEIGAM